MALKKILIDALANLIKPIVFFNYFKVKDLDEKSSYKLLNQFDTIPTGSLYKKSKKNGLDKKEHYDLNVVIPVYNVQDYVSYCIDSVLNNKTTYKFQVTIVNDGSTDKSFEIVKKYKDIKNVVIVNQKNKGLSFSRNVGIDSCNCDYLLFVDSDDLISHNTIQKMMDSAVEYGAEIVQGSFKKFNDEKSKTVFYEDNKNASVKLLNGYPWGKLFKRELFNNIKFPEGYYFEDTILSLIVYFKAKKIVTISDVVYYYRLNKSGIVSRMKNSVRSIDTVWITNQVVNNLENLNCNFVNCKEFQEKLLKQIAINFRRTAFLRPKMIQKAVFTESRECLKKIVKTRCIDDYISVKLVLALNSDNFYDFFIFCFLIKYF